MPGHRGAGNKKGQKFQNVTAFNPTKYGANRRQIEAERAPVGLVCGRCRDKIEWKKKYNK